MIWRSMAERNVQQAQQARDELRCVVGFSVADEIQKLDGLKKAGSISDAEFARLMPGSSVTRAEPSQPRADTFDNAQPGAGTLTRNDMAAN